MKVIIWHQSANFEVFKRAVGALNRVYDKVELLGMTSHLPPPAEAAALYKKGLKPIDKNELKTIEHDMILVCGKDASPTPVLQEADSLGIDADKIVLDRTVCVPGFTLENYKKLRHSKLSILSNNCWGGIIYNTFGLEFLSPTVNLFFRGGGFKKFLRAPMEYMDKELRFYKMNFNSVTKKHYPSFWLGDAEVVMLHYTDADSVNTARSKWEERRQRINWYNLLFKANADNVEKLEEVERLPFAKKICVVPFETELHSGFHIDYGNVPDDKRWTIELDVSNSAIWHYNLWDLLLYGKKTPLKV